MNSSPIYTSSYKTAFFTLPLLSIALFYLAIPIGQAILFTRAQPFFSLWDVINYTASFGAYYLIMNEIIIAAKLPVLQYIFPHDKAIILHIISGIGISFFIYLHGVYKIVSGIYIDILSWVLLVSFTLLFIGAVSWVQTPLFRWMYNRITRIIGTSAKYDIKRMLHGWGFCIFAVLSYIHTVQAGVNYLLPRWAAIVHGIYFGVAIAFFIVSQLHRYTLKQTQLMQNITVGNTRLLRFTRPARFQYKPGQFAYLRFAKTGNKHIDGEFHPFSFLSFPEEDLLSFGITAAGDYTEALSEIQKGAKAYITGGYGNFVPSFTQPTCLIGTGAGITPILSILKYAQHHNQTLSAFLAVRSPDDILEPETVTSLKQVSNITLRTFITTETSQRIDRSLLAALPNPQETAFYICSSPSVRTKLIQEIQTLHVPKRNIHFDKFSFSL